jgi:hypothetical protein
MVLSKLKYPSLRSRPAQGKSLNVMEKESGRAESFRRVGFLAGSSGKVSDASDFLPEAPGRIYSCRISCRKLREGYLRVGFLAGSSGKAIFVSDFLPEAPGRLSLCRISCRKLREGYLRVGFLAGSSREDFRRAENLAGSSGKISDAQKTSPEAPGSFPTRRKPRRKLRARFSMHWDSYRLFISRY